jgi:hypothetical protein
VTPGTEDNCNITTEDRMEHMEATDTVVAPARPGILTALPPWLRARRTLLLLAAALIAAGLALNWGWLTAVGAAPIILALAPCVAMCALGLCIHGGGKSCHGGGSSAAQRSDSKPGA